MALTKVLITVKTYPSLSTKYDELVCTAGFTEDGQWIRIYPVPFRKLDFEGQYKKWQWIEIDLEKNTSDFRPESFKTTKLESIKVLGKVDREDNWFERKKLTLNKVYDNLDLLIAEAKDKKIVTSLAVLKPKEILDFVIEAVDINWDKNKIASILAKQEQISLFDIEESKKVFEVVRKVPYKFSYKFTTEDNKERTIMIEDWEIGQLYWNCFDKYKDEKIACKKVREKYYDTFLKKNEIYFFMGTTFLFHYRAPNPFLIIGVFYPPKDNKVSLF